MATQKKKKMTPHMTLQSSCEKRVSVFSLRVRGASARSTQHSVGRVAHGRRATGAAPQVLDRGTYSTVAAQSSCEQRTKTKCALQVLRAGPAPSIKPDQSKKKKKRRFAVRSVAWSGPRHERAPRRMESMALCMDSISMVVVFCCTMWFRVEWNVGQVAA